MLAARLSLLSKFQLSILPISLSFLLFPFLAASVYSLSIRLLSDLILQPTSGIQVYCLVAGKGEGGCASSKPSPECMEEGASFLFKKKYSIALIC